MTRVQLRRWLPLGAVSIGAAIAAFVACGSPYSAAPDARVEAGTGDGPEASGDGAAGDAAPPDPCKHVFAPTPPDLDDAPGDELPPFYIAVRTTRISNDTKTIRGFDLDGVCTCNADKTTAHAGVASCLSAKPSCDLDGGVDNAVSVLAAQVSPFFSLDTVPQRLIDTGRRTLLLEIGKYNGRRNDKEVAFGVALSDGIRVQGCPTSTENAAKGIWTPGWCGDDVWSFLPEAVVPATNQPLIQGLGFVKDGVLTLQLEGSLLLPFDESSVLPLGGTVMTGTLTPLGDDLNPRDPNMPPATERQKRLFRLDDALIGGRVKATQLLAGVGTVDTAVGDAGPAYLCEQSSYELLRKGICGAVDLASTQALDFDPQAKCDSLSVGITFTAFPVLPGALHMTNLVANPCAAGPSGEPPDGGTPYSCAP